MFAKEFPFTVEVSSGLGIAYQVRTRWMERVRNQLGELLGRKAHHRDYRDLTSTAALSRCAGFRLQPALAPCRNMVE